MVQNIRLDIGRTYRVVLGVKRGGQEDAEKKIDHQR